MHDDMHPTPPKSKPKLFERLRMPRWFNRFFFYWLAVILTLTAIGLGIYVLSGKWTPEHLRNIFFMGL